MHKRLFTSYSRRDGRYVADIIRLLRVTGASVFRDQDSIAPGKQWRAEISTALADSDTVLVFWSENAQTSAEMKAEYESAINLGKDVVPVLLDKAPLTDLLQQFQYIDFSEFFLPHSSEGLVTHGKALRAQLFERVFSGSGPG